MSPRARSQPCREGGRTGAQRVKVIHRLEERAARTPHLLIEGARFARARSARAKRARYWFLRYPLAIKFPLLNQDFFFR